MVSCEKDPYFIFNNIIINKITNFDSENIVKFNMVQLKLKYM